MAVNIISATDTATTDWSGGQTTQLYIYPQDADYKKRTFKLRLSSATVTADKSAFTKLKNIDRILMTLDNQIELEHDGQKKITIEPLKAHYFSGDSATVSYGCCQDFNVMLGHGSYKKAELFFNEAGQFDLYPDTDECFLYVYTGSYHIINKEDTCNINAGDLMHLTDFSAVKVIRSSLDAKMIVFKLNW